VMTKSALKTLWFGGGGVLATWLAVTPNHAVPPVTTTAPQQPAATRDPSAVDWKAQAERLRWRTEAVTLRASTRNPFRFNSPKPAAPSTPPRESGVQSAAIEPTTPTAPIGPVMKLSGVAQKGGKRTAILSGDGQIYLVGEGDSVVGRFTVVTIDPEAVLLRDAAGAEQWLVLPQ
jgi:hypothetical protein